MRRKMSKALAVLLSACMAVSVVPVSDLHVKAEPIADAVSVSAADMAVDATNEADASEEAESEALLDIADKTAYAETKTITSKAGADNDALFEGYVNEVFGLDDKEDVPAQTLTLGESLPAKEYNAYCIYKEIFTDIANGERDSAVVEIPLKQLMDKEYYSASDLGVSSVVEGGSISQEAFEALIDKSKYDFGIVVDALLADCPYEMYWYEKTKGSSWTASYSVSATYANGEYLIGFSDEAVETLTFTVDSAYRPDNASTLYEVDTNKTGAAKNAAAYAQTIVAAAKDKSDYEKLHYYREQICELVSYNDEARDDNDPASLSPWQLIYVFDRNPATNVVCEGYSKAFQYLCNSTKFDSADIYSILVTGEMDGGTGAGPHMWNVLHMDDGNNYLVDVTNCDDGTVGNDVYLFLQGSDNVFNFTDGSYAGYIINIPRIDRPNGSFSRPTSITYTYDYEMILQYGEDAIQLAESDYVAPVAKPAAPNAPTSFSICQGTQVSDGLLSKNTNWIWDTGVTDKKAPEIAGESIKVVAVYNGADKDDYSDTTVTVTINAKAHATINAFKSDVEELEATCTEPPRTLRQYKCDSCSQFFGEKEYFTNGFGWALGHSYTQKIKEDKYIAVPSENGSPAVYYYACERCGEFQKAAVYTYCDTPAELVYDSVTIKEGESKNAFLISNFQQLYYYIDYISNYSNGYVKYTIVDKAGNELSDVARSGQAVLLNDIKINRFCSSYYWNAGIIDINLNGHTLYLEASADTYEGDSQFSVGGDSKLVISNGTIVGTDANKDLISAYGTAPSVELYNVNATMGRSMICLSKGSVLVDGCTIDVSASDTASVIYYSGTNTQTSVTVNDCDLTSGQKAAIITNAPTIKVADSSIISKMNSAIYCSLGGEDTTISNSTLKGYTEDTDTSSGKWKPAVLIKGNVNVSDGSLMEGFNAGLIATRNVTLSDSTFKAVSTGTKDATSFSAAFLYGGYNYSDYTVSIENCSFDVAGAEDRVDGIVSICGEDAGYSYGNTSSSVKVATFLKAGQHFNKIVDDNAYYIPGSVKVGVCEHDYESSICKKCGHACEHPGVEYGDFCEECNEKYLHTHVFERIDISDPRDYCPKCGGVKLTDTIVYFENGSTVTFSGSGEIPDYNYNPFQDELNYKSIVIKPGITRIGKNAFLYEDITSVQLPEGLLSIGESAFRGCDRLTAIDVPDSVTSIETLAFAETDKLASVSLGEGITALADDTFKKSAIKEFKVPKNMKTVSSKAFSDCYYLATLAVDEENQYFKAYDNVIFNKDMTTLVMAPIANDYLKVSTWDVRVYEIPDTVTKIGDYAFANSYYSNRVVIPGTVKEVGEGAFYNAMSGSVKISEGIEIIGASAFEKAGLSSNLTLPLSIKSAGSRAFANNGLRTVTIPCQAADYGAYDIFDDNPSLTSINMATNHAMYSKLLERYGERVVIYDPSSKLHDFEIGENNEHKCKLCGYTGEHHFYFGGEGSCMECGMCPSIYNTGKHAITAYNEDIHECKYCGQTFAHTWEVKAYSDQHEKVCSVCGYVDESSAEMHTFADGKYYSDEAGKHYRICESCKQRVEEECFGGWSNCLEKAVCIKCGNEYGDVNPSVHISKNITYTSNHDATCTKDGTRLAQCKCGESWNEPDVDSKIGHSFKNTKDVVYTWEEDASACTITVPCANGCDEDEEGRVMVYADVASEIDTAVPSDCKDYGYTTYKIEYVQDESTVYSDTKTIYETTLSAHKYGTNGRCAICDKPCNHEDEFGESTLNENHICTICGALIEISSEDMEILKDPDDVDAPVVVPTELWVAGIEDKDFDATAQKQDKMHVYWAGILLEEGTDYTVKYINNINAGTATVVITGKGNYSGTITKYFTINPIAMDSSDVLVEDITLAYNGKVQRGVPAVQYYFTNEDGDVRPVTLKYGVDFVCEYDFEDKRVAENPYKDSGVYQVTLKGIKNYGKALDEELMQFAPTCTETILGEGAVPMNKVSCVIASQKYTGDAVVPAPGDITVTYKTKTLKYGQDYEIYLCYDNVDIGTGKVVLDGLGKYTGREEFSFKIKGSLMSKVKVANLEALVYDGTEQEQLIADMHDEEPVGVKLYIPDSKGRPKYYLYEGEDFEVSYDKNVNASSKATIIFTGINGYEGVLKKSFTIKPAALSEDDVAIIGDTVYQKGGAKPDIVVTNPITGEELEAGVDYKVSYTNNDKISDGVTGSKIPTATITGKGNFGGSVKVKYAIIANNLGIAADGITVTASDVVYKKEAGICKPKLAIYDENGKKLEADVDYASKIVYTYMDDTLVTQIKNRKPVEVERFAGDVVNSKDIIPVDTVILATATGKGKYRGDGEEAATVSTCFRFVKADLSKASVKIPTQYFTGYAITPGKDEITVKVPVGGKTVTLAPEDYEIAEYINNVNKGTAKVVLVPAEGSPYGGSITAKYTIKVKSMNYTIVYEKNKPAESNKSVIGTMKNSSTKSGAKLTNNVYTLSGYKFAGWNTEADGSGDSYANKEAFELKGDMRVMTYGETIHLYAQWIKK